MSKALSGAIRTAFEEKIQQPGWQGEVGKDLKGDFWIAPLDWRVPDEDFDSERSYDLFFKLDFVGDVYTWTVYFLGTVGLFGPARCRV
ncbi:hypothetical protein [Ruegeria sp. SCP11]|uniref:hypothetical protein n=1 Tax=Ruegeria sp. SCP11 TaxID=3141378 RepID=UPI003339659F